MEQQEIASNFLSGGSLFSISSEIFMIIGNEFGKRARRISKNKVHAHRPMCILNAITLMQSSELFSSNFHYLFAFKPRIVGLIRSINESLNPNIIPRRVVPIIGNIDAQARYFVHRKYSFN